MNKYHQVETDLNWYFNHSDAAIGFKSSHAAFVSALYGTSATDINTDPYTDGVLKQVRKLRRIRNTFHSLPTKTKRALEACYNYECQFRYPPELVSIYGNKSGCSLFNTYVLELIPLIKLCKNKLSSKLSPNEELLLFNIGVETRQFWESINQQYLTARQIILDEKK